LICQLLQTGIGCAQRRGGQRDRGELTRRNEGLGFHRVSPERGGRSVWQSCRCGLWEDKLCRKLPAAEVAKRTGRALGAVYARRASLGVPDGRTKAERRKVGR
jgi:hypothetical protein